MTVQPCGNAEALAYVIQPDLLDDPHRGYQVGMQCRCNFLIDSAIGTYQLGRIRGQRGSLGERCQRRG
jgi:hypothetical protein